MNLKRVFQRKLYEAKAINSDFFDGISIKDKTLKKKILQWMFYLKTYKNISINKFSYLFSKFEDITFPLKIYGYSGKLWGEDNSGKQFYFSYSPLDFYNMANFSIGIRTKYFDTEFVYFLTSKGEIVVHEKLILQLTENQTNSNNMVSFRYDEKSPFATAVLETKTLTITIKYLSRDCINNSLATYLFALCSEFEYIDDVFFMLTYLLDLLETCSFTIQSYTNKSKEILSSICVSGGIVTQYCYTTRPSTSQICLHKQTLSEELQKFILSHKN